MRTLLMGLGIVCASSPAFAYDTGSEVGSECHENLTRRAIADARDALSTESMPFPSDIDEDALMSDLLFEVDARDRFDTVATTLANREVDLAGHEPAELSRLAQIHGADENQVEHCLRRSDQDEPDGSAQALEACRSYIRDQAVRAIDAGEGERMPLKTTLSLRGEVELSLPMQYVMLGRALHALQDGFSHSYRTEDGTEVTAVLNYVDLAEDTHDPAIDGPAHSGHLDGCTDLDPLRERRWILATDASTELATIVLDPQLPRAMKLEAIDDLLARNFSLQPGCTADDGWCGAPEAEFADSDPCTCTHVRSASASWVWLLAPFALLLLRRKRLTLAFAGALVCCSASTARASDFGVYISGSGAIMNAAFATSLGARYSPTDNWTLGLDAEWNPWIGGGLDKVRSGAINAYGTVIFRIPMRTESVSLRSTLQLGATRTMFDLVGVPEGSIGPYVGFSALGVAWAFAEDLALVIDPAHISVPIPKLSGVPFAFPQYRVTLGLQWGG